MKASLGIVLLLAIAIGAFAQTASVNGIVTDSSQAVMVGATITVTNVETGLRVEAHTNEAGNYTIPLLPVGRYRIAAAMAGFNTQSLPEVKLDVGQVARLDFTLKPGAISETVQVTAS